MSRIGKLPITIPENVDVNYNESEITVKGKFGTLQTKYSLMKLILHKIITLEK
jgi:ribosomal protein L6P/L9E